ncbi:winged helix DNA-binding domain-containing protein [Mycetocola sp.]|uniref:winged helix DNA-binding domain-containing protein n=1 Tax=Mycetocola sp. TaxID=1871042 RepID=UPI003988E92E
MALESQAVDRARRRLVAQRIQRPLSASPLDTVTHLTAMQGQDLPGVLWSIGLRTPDATEADVRAAFDRRELVRSWPMRGTLHVTTPDDLRLILPLSRHRLTTSFATRHRELGISPADVSAATDAGVRALADGPLVRKALLAVFEAAGQSISGQRGIHLIGAMAHAGMICLGPFVGKEQAFVLLDEWTPPVRAQLDREDAIVELAVRYFTSHGPATEADFAWWANLTLTDVRAAISRTGDRLSSLTTDTTTWHASTDVLTLERPLPGARAVHALPGFDENLLGYTDRSAALATEHAQLIVPGNNGMFKATIVIGGRVVGTWARSEKPDVIHVTALPFAALSSSQESALAKAISRYGRFKGKPADLTIAAGAGSGSR